MLTVLLQKKDGVSRQLHEANTVRRSLLCISRTFLSTAVLQQDDGGRFRELHEAHIARLAAENKLAEIQARLASTSMSASQQARLPLELLLTAIQIQTQIQSISKS